MKANPETPQLDREKHDNGSFNHGPVICLLDKRGRALWTSDDPRNETGRANESIIDHVGDADKKRLLELMAECIVGGQTVQYDVIGAPGVRVVDPTMIAWRVRMWPADYAALTAACCICYRLDPAWGEIKEDEITLLRHLCNDCTLIEIADRMMLSESAIDSKVRKLKEKLRCHNIGGLVAAAINGGILLN